MSMSKIPKVSLPYILLGLYLMVLIYLRGKIPNPETLIDMLKNLYGSYGYSIVFFGALLEATFLITLYVPGSTVVILGAALSRTGVIQFPVVISLAILGFLIGYCLNYILGRYGWYHVLARFGFEKGIEVAKEKLERHQVKTILFGYFHPSGGSFISTAAGVLNIPFKRFFILSLIAQTFWAILWGSLAYYFGLPLVEFFLKYFSFVVLGGILIWVIRRVLKKENLF